MLPDSSLLMSRMSLMRCRSILLAARILAASSATSSETSSLRIISLRPMIVLMGVRISWLMLEKKRFCASFSAAISLRCFSFRSLSFLYMSISMLRITPIAMQMNASAV